MKTRDNKKAFVTGITGQDGPYLAELLLEKGYEVHAIRRRGATDNTGRIKNILNHERFWLHYGDMTDGSTLDKLVSMIKPDEVYNLAAMSHVRISFDIPVYTADASGLGVTRLLEAIRTAGLEKTCKFYQI